MSRASALPAIVTGLPWGYGRRDGDATVHSGDASTASRSAGTGISIATPGDVQFATPIGLDGTRVRRESGDDPNDGMGIDVESDRATPAHLPESPGRAWEEDQEMWGGDGLMTGYGAANRTDALRTESLPIVRRRHVHGYRTRSPRRIS